MVLFQVVPEVKGQPMMWYGSRHYLTTVMIRNRKKVATKLKTTILLEYFFIQQIATEIKLDFLKSKSRGI